MTRALLLVAAVLLVAAGCGGGGDKSSVATTTVTKTLTAGNTTATGAVTVTTHGRFHYPREVTDNYMRSCTASPKATHDYCACTLDKLSNNVSTADFQRIGLSGGQIPTRIRTLITQAARDCRDKL